MKLRFNDFRAGVAYRTIFLGVTMALLAYIVVSTNLYLTAIPIFCVIILQLYNIFIFVSQTNDKLTRFLESVKYSDFLSGFTVDNNLGKSFKDLNLAFNEVLEAFRKTRSEKEEHWHYLNTVVQQVRTGILSYNNDGEILLLNNNAKKFLNVTYLRNIKELIPTNLKLYDALVNVEPHKGELYQDSNRLYLTIQASKFRIRGVDVKLVTLQNIQAELQQQELMAWQNLTRVLRHEIMNSITPISSLTSTLQEILEYDMKKVNSHWEVQQEQAEDLREGLGTIASRSQGLIKFIDAYREYTSLPKPNITTVKLNYIIQNVANLMKVELRKTRIDFHYECFSEYLIIQADAEMIEQVLINLFKNSIEGLSETAKPELQLIGTYDEYSVKIEVIDNGQGIIKEALEHIFVPFYSTKPNGSGIGLSLSRQIMQMHNGSITVTSEPNERTVFTLRFISH